MLEKNKAYTLSEFCKVLRESQEFKPKKGEKVESEDKKNNEKAVNDILKQSKEFDGGLSDKGKRENPRDVVDFNKTTLEVDFVNEPSDDYKKRVKAQVHGFASAENEKNSKMEEDSEGLDFNGNKDFYKERSEVAKTRSDRRHALKTSGLQSKELAKDDEFDDEFKDKTVFTNENKKMKRLCFSKTVFLNEEEMLKKVPNDMKIDGNKFYMKDSVGNEYLVECAKDKVIDQIIHTKVVDYVNKEKINETFNRMKELYGYKSSGNIQNSAKVENEMVGKMLSEAKEKLTVKKEDATDKFFTIVLQESPRTSVVG